MQENTSLRREEEIFSKVQRQGIGLGKLMHSNSCSIFFNKVTGSAVIIDGRRKDSCCHLKYGFSHDPMPLAWVKTHDIPLNITTTTLPTLKQNKQAR